MTGSRTLEICVDSVDGMLAAVQGGAHRVELCAELGVGGVTPSAGLLEEAAGRCTLPVHVMVRPRAGDFCYTPAEIDVMRRDIEAAKGANVRGVVLGILTVNGEVDRPTVEELVGRARPLSVTFHRAFDMTRDPLAALETLIEIGIDRVLSSGQEKTALEGVDLLRELIRRASGRMVVMPGAGVRPENVAQIVQVTGATEVHASARIVSPSRMRFKNSRCTMGHEPDDEYSRGVTDVETVRGLVEALDSLRSP